MQGSGLLGMAITIPGVECVGAADLYDGRHTLAKEITGNPNLPTSREYQELLDRKDIDCIVAAVPDHWHRRVVVDACNAGKDIYCEKPMSHNVADGLAMVEASQKNNRIVQIGSQRVSSVLCETARDLYQKGTIGDVEMVELTLGRNDPTGAWQYPPPPDLSPQTLDWDTVAERCSQDSVQPSALRALALLEGIRNGSCGRSDGSPDQRHAGHLGMERNSHARRLAMGGIFRFKDGRDMPDFHTVLFDYHGIPVYVRLDLGCETPELARFMGPKGILDAGEFDLKHYFQPGIDLAPSYYAFSFPAKMREAYFKQWHEEHDPQLGKEPEYLDTFYKGHDWDDMRPHLNVFFQAVKSRKDVTENAVFGNHAADRLPHGERVVLPRREAGHLGRGVENDQVVSMERT